MVLNCLRGQAWPAVASGSMLLLNCFCGGLEIANIWVRSGQVAQTSRRRVGANVLTETKCCFASNNWCFSARYAILNSIAS
eukprot:g11468.t1